MTGITITRDERERAAAPRAPARAGAQERGQAAAAELIADFKNQMGQEYAFDQDEVWEQATKAAEAVVAKSQAQVHARCRELKIPDRFAPNLSLDWHHRGYGNVLESRAKTCASWRRRRSRRSNKKPSCRWSCPASRRKSSLRSAASPRTRRSGLSRAVRCAVASIAMSLK